MNRIKHIFILLVNFVGLLVIVSILLIVLNYFKIIPLSKTFPKYLGWMPVYTEKAKSQIKPSYPNGATAWIRSDPTLIANYTDYFKTHFTSDSAMSDTTGSIENSVLIGYNSNFIQVLTPQKTIILKITANTQFNKFNPPTTTKQGGSGGVERLTVSYKTANDFFSDAPFGSFLKITYNTLPDTNLEALTIDYYPDHKY